MLPDMSTKVRLSIMMFLEYAVKGLWFPLASFFLTASVDDGGLGFTESQKGIIIAVTFAVGAFLSPFVGQLCDRYFATEKTLAVLLFSTGVLQIAVSYQTTFTAWLVLGTAFAVLYTPTVALTNSLAMSHLGTPKREFPQVRVWGTFGWIAVAWLLRWFWLEHDLQFQWLPPFLKGIEHQDVVARQIDAIWIAGFGCIAYAFFCWFGLPRTPPVRDRGKKFALGEAFGLFRRRSFFVLLFAGLTISCIHFMYFMQMGAFLVAAGLERAEVGPAMSIGQFSEIVVMAMLGRFLTKVGFRACITVGAASFVARYLIFSMTGLPVWAHVTAQLFHGLCFACFFGASFIYVDRIAPKDARHSAQTLYLLVMLGIGPVISSWLNGVLARTADTADGKFTLAGFGTYWTTLAVIGAAGSVLFAVFFRDETEKEDQENTT